MLHALASIMLAAIASGWFPAPSVAVHSAAAAPASHARVETETRALDEEPTLADLLVFQKRVVEVGERLSEATVGLTVGPNQGSGVIVTADGVIATAGHLFERVGQRVSVTLKNGRKLRGVTLGYNEDEDYGLMRITSSGEWPHLPLHAAGGHGRNEPCLAAGHPGGFQLGRTPVLRLGRIISQRGPFLRTDCAIAMGDSGGPLIDLDGRVIGIHSRIRERVSANYHVDAGKVLRDWDRLIAGEVWDAEGAAFPRGPILGVQVQDVPAGPRVQTAYADLPAAKAGIIAGDIIVSIDGQPVKDTETLLATIAKRKAGERVKVAILRENESKEFDIELARGAEVDR